MRLILLACLLASFSALSCGGDSPTTPIPPSNQPDPVATVEIIPDEVSLTALGDTTRFLAIARDGSGRTVGGAEVSWSTANEQVATVGSTTGLASAIGNGTTVIIAEADGVQGSSIFTVAQVVSTVSVQPETRTLTSIGDTMRLVAEALDANRNPVPNQAWSWESSNPAVASVSSEGLVTTLDRGTATISAQAGSIDGNAVITVTQELASVTVSPISVSFGALGDTNDLIATAMDAQGIVIPDVGFTWTSSSPSVAEVDQAGLVTAVSNGAASIIASSSGVESSAEISVSQIATTLSVDPPNVALLPGDSIQLTAVVADANGHEIIDASYDYVASDPALLTVDAYGLVEVSAEASPGASGTIDVTSGGVAATVVIAVSDRGERLAAGGGHTCFVGLDGLAYCWGDGQYGQLGNGSNDPAYQPDLVATGVSLGSVTAGFAHTCSVASTGDAYCWGYNPFGQLGDGSKTDRNTPTLVVGGHSFSPVISVGNAATCGITESGDTYCWGAGQVGGASSVPVLVSGDHQFFTVDVGGDHACAIEPGGTAYCWGLDNQGQVGNGPAPTSAVPIPVSGGHTFVSVATADVHSCGVTTTSDAYCWGDNRYGQLGDGTTINRDEPVLVSGGLTFTSVKATYHFTCGLTESGEVYCWGDNSFGQIGDGTKEDRSIPVAVTGGQLFSEIATGSYHACGRTSLEDIYCWGENGAGRLGDGTTTDRFAQTLVQW